MDEVLRVRVLGPADLTLGGRTLVERMPAKAAALLFYLALTGGAHSRSELAGLLWSDLPEETARANLRLVLTKLRRVLPEHVAVTRRDVRLTAVPPVWIDALEVAGAGADDVEPEDLLAAVRLCDGDLLDGFAVPGAPVFDDWVAGRRAAVRAETLALMDRAVAQARDRRDAATGIEVARRMVGTEPLLEEAHRALMWFLALGGHRSAALAQYDTCRYLLREELGAEPSAVTIALRDEINVTGGFTELAGAASPGPERRSVGQRVGPASATPDLPRPLTTLVGREAELARLHELLDDPACRLLTLVGPGGIGKTRLATELVGSGRHDHLDGAAFVSFVGTETARKREAPGLVVATVARALGVSLAVPLDPMDLLADHLSSRRMLLVLDNLEHLRDGAGAISELLLRAPGLTVVVTSRRPLGLGAEWLVEVPGLACPAVGSDAEVAGYAAVELSTTGHGCCAPATGPATPARRGSAGSSRGSRWRSSWRRGGSGPRARKPSRTGSRRASTCSRRPHRTSSSGTAASGRSSTGRTGCSPTTSGRRSAGCRCCGTASTSTRPRRSPMRTCRCWRASSTTRSSSPVRTAGTPCTSCCGRSPQSGWRRTRWRNG
jgi:DNA-binding SARP family transcriptional activator